MAGAIPTGLGLGRTRHEEDCAEHSSPSCIKDMGQELGPPELNSSLNFPSHLHSIQKAAGSQSWQHPTQTLCAVRGTAVGSAPDKALQLLNENGAVSQGQQQE